MTSPRSPRHSARTATGCTRSTSSRPRCARRWPRTARRSSTCRWTTAATSTSPPTFTTTLSSDHVTHAHGHFRDWAAALLAHHRAAHDNEVYQFSTISALLDGVYDGDATVADILRHGDFGLGTFNHLDGEMVILDGVCYRLWADGTASRAASTDRTPFAAVTRFHTDFAITIPTATDRAQVIAAIDQRITSANLIYAIRVTGHFSDMHTRTVME